MSANATNTGQAYRQSWSGQASVAWRIPRRLRFLRALEAVPFAYVRYTIEASRELFASDSWRGFCSPRGRRSPLRGVSLRCDSECFPVRTNNEHAWQLPSISYHDLSFDGSVSIVRRIVYSVRRIKYVAENDVFNGGRQVDRRAENGATRVLPSSIGPHRHDRRENRRNASR